VLVPAYEASRSLGAVLVALRQGLPEATEGGALLVIDDGSRDGTGDVARSHGVDVLRHEHNRGKGAALVTGLSEAKRRGFDVALTVDADGQHPAESARDVLFGSPDPATLVLGVRDLAREGAPRKNQVSNAISNFFLSRFARKHLSDTQCGLRRYPVARTLALSARASGYAFEAEVLLRAARRGVAIVERPVRVIYPPADERTTHFDSVKDPMRIIAAVLRTAVELGSGS
jgi:glycosyltransferase involved in cell wall biosynthesis